MSLTAQQHIALKMQTCQIWNITLAFFFKHINKFKHIFFDTGVSQNQECKEQTCVLGENALASRPSSWKNELTR